MASPTTCAGSSRLPTTGKMRHPSALGGKASQRASVVSTPRRWDVPSFLELPFNAALSAITRLDLPVPYGPVHVNAACPDSAMCFAMVRKTAADDGGHRNPSKAVGSERSVSIRMDLRKRRATLTRSASVVTLRAPDIAFRILSSLSLGCP